MKRYFKRCLALLILCFPAAGHSNELIDEALSSYVMDVGISFHQLGLEVKPAKENIRLGKLADSMMPTFLVNAETPPSYIGSSRWGYNLIAGFSGFCINRQEVEGESVDLDTNASGFFAYVTPTFFYTFGDRRVRRRDESSFRAGLGFGLGYLKASGDMVFTETVPQENHDFDISGFGASSSVFLEYQRGRWIYRLKGAGPSVTDGEYQYSMTDLYIGVAYLVKR